MKGKEGTYVEGGEVSVQLSLFHIITYMTADMISVCLHDYIQFTCGDSTLS